MITVAQRRELDRLIAERESAALALTSSDQASLDRYGAAVEACWNHLDALTDWSTAPVLAREDG